MQNPHRTRAFAAYEWMIAWRYLRARRAEGGVSVMTWISLIGIALAVFALIATLAVRSGFRHEFVGTVLGANPHATVLSPVYVTPEGRTTRAITDYDAIGAAIGAVDGVIHAAPVINGEVLASHSGRNAGVQVVGIRLPDLLSVPLVATPHASQGDVTRFDDGVAIGSGVARELNLTIGDHIRLVSAEGVKTAFGIAPRAKSYEVVHIFEVGRYDIDRVRVYMPFAEAQGYFNAEGSADRIEIFVADPEAIDDMVPALIAASGGRVYVWTWRDASGAFLQALRMEDNAMFIILSILVLIASLNIVSGLIMLVKNKGRDIGILRTIGLDEGAVLRVFFICGAATGVVGTIVGVTLGCLFAIYIDPVFSFVDWVLGGGAWDPSIRYLPSLPARLETGDVTTAVLLSLGLSFGVTWFPARRAARMNPVEALRYE